MVEVTFIELRGLMIQDPMTLFTDLLLGIQCLYYAWRLRGSQATELGGFFWFFLLMGIGSIEGGFVNHGFYYLLGPGWKSPMVLIIGLSLSCLQWASLASGKEHITPRVFRVLRLLIVLQWIGFLIYLSRFPLGEIDFKMLVPHLFIGLFVFVLILQAYFYFLDRRPSRQWLMAGVLAIIPAGLVTVLRYSPDKWFNQFDLVHVLLIPAMWLMWKSVKQSSR